MKKRILSWLLVLTMIISIIPSTMITALAAVTIPSSFAGEYDVADLSQATFENGKTYRLYGNGTTPVVIETGVNVTIVLDNATIESTASPIQVKGGATLRLVLKADTTNTLTCTSATETAVLNSNAKGLTAGISVPENATLAIENDTAGSATLNVTGGYGGAGIGGSYTGVSSTAKAADGSNGAQGETGKYFNYYPYTGVKAGGAGGNKGTGGYYGNNASNAGTITLNGCIVNATGGVGGAGIGGGRGADGRNGTDGSAGIDGQQGTNYGNPAFSDYYITGSSGSGGGGGGGAGGNGGDGGAGGTVSIVGGAVTAIGGTGAAGIGGGAGGKGGNGGYGNRGGNAVAGIQATHTKSNSDYYGRAGGGGAGGSGSGGTAGNGGNGGAGSTLTINGGAVTARGYVGTGGGQVGARGTNGASASSTHNGSAGAGDTAWETAHRPSWAAIDAWTAGNGNGNQWRYQGLIFRLGFAASGGNGGAGGTVAAKTVTNGADGVLNITGSSNNVDFVNTDGVTTTNSRPVDKNGALLYKTVITVRNLEGTEVLPNATISVPVTGGTAYNYETVTDSLGRGILWLPAGTYVLKGKMVQSSAAGYMTEEKTLTVAANDANTLTVNVGIDLTVKASTASKVYFSDDAEMPLNLVVDASRINVQIQSIRWFREPVNDNDQLYGTGSVLYKPFSEGYDAADITNKQEVAVTGKTINIPVNQNGRYWLEIVVQLADADGNTTAITLTKLLTVSNIFRTYPIEFRSQWIESVGGVSTVVSQVPSDGSYGSLLEADGTVSSQKVGFAWDLDGYNAADITTGTLLNEPSGGCDTVQFFAQDAYLGYNKARLGTHSYVLDETTDTYPAFEKTLDDTFLTSANKDCDTTDDGTAQYSKYTMKYTPKDDSLNIVSIYGRVQENGAVDTDAAPLYTSQRAYTKMITSDNVTASDWAGYKLVGVCVNGAAAEFVKNADGTDSKTVALKQIWGDTAAGKDRIRTVEFLYEYNMTDVTIHGYLKGTQTPVFDDITVSAEIGTSFTYPQPVIAGYNNESADPAGGTIDQVAEGDEITFYYLHSNGNVTYQAVDGSTLLASKTTTVANGGAVDKSKQKAADVLGDIPYYTLADVDGTATADTYDGLHDVTVTYTYTRNTHKLTIEKKDVDSGSTIATQEIENVPAGLPYTFGPTEVTSMDKYTAVAALNPTSYAMGDADATVTFWYRKNAENRYATITVNSLCDEDGDGTAEVFQHYQIPAFKDVELTIPAPTWTGYKLKDGAQNSQTITPTGDMAVNFEYVLDAPRTITVELNNNTEGGTLTVPGYQTSYTIKKGGSVTIQAPVINGYALVNGSSIVTIHYDDAEPANNKVVFNYASVETANFVKHTIVFKNHDESIEFYRYSTLVSKSDSETTYTADSVQNVIAGYKLTDIRMKIEGDTGDTTNAASVTAPNNKNVTIVYRFEEDTSRIVIKKELSDGMTVADTVLTGYRTGLKNVEVTAPLVDDYALAKDQPLVQSIGDLKSGDNVITFKYDKIGNVTFTLKEHNDATGTDDIIAIRNGELDETYDPNQTGNPLDLSAAKYRFVASASATDPFDKENGTVTVSDTSGKKNYDVFYTKGTRPVTFVAIDSALLTQDAFDAATADQIQKATITSRDLTERARIGETYKASAQSVDRYALDDQISKYYTVEDNTDTLYVYFWYRAKSAGTVTVHYHYGSKADHDKAQLLMSYSMDAVVGEKVIISIPEYLEGGKYKLPAGEERTQTVLVTDGGNPVEIYYDANFVTVNVKTKRSDFATAAEYETHEVTKTDALGSVTGNLTLTPPYRAGYTLVGITGVGNGSETALPTDVYQDGKLTLTGLAADTTITYFYNKTSATEYQSDLTIQYQYNGYDLAASKTIKVNRDEANAIDLPAFEGYAAKSYTFENGNSTTTEDIGTAGISITPTADAVTLTIRYVRPDNTIVLPGKDGEIGPAPKDEDNVIVKPGDKEPSIDGNGSVTIPKDDNNSTVTRPDPSNPGGKEEVKVPGGTVIDKDGNITLPDGGGTIKPGDRIPEDLPENSDYIAITYHSNNSAKEVKRELGKKNVLAVQDNSFTDPDGAQFTGWNDNGTGNGTTYTKGQTVAQSVTLYAQWKSAYRYSATIQYQPNGGTPDETVRQTVGNNTDQNLIGTLRSNPFQVTGWTFGGWNEAANGSGKLYQPGAAFALTVNETKDLFAQWYKQDGSSITVPGKDGDPNNEATNVIGSGDGIRRDPVTGIITIPAGGTITVTDPKTGEKETILLPNGGTLNPDGSYTINQPDGGKIDVDKDGNETPKDDKGDEKPAVEIVTMTYYINNGTDGAMNVKAVKGEKVSIIASPFKWDGYTFLNWMGTDKQEYDPADEFTAQEMEFFAQWYKKDDSTGGNGSIELPGKDGAIEAPHDKDNVIVTPGNGGTLDGPKKPDGTVEVKDGEATVTRPDPSDPNYPNGAKEDIKVPEGSTIYPDGTIKLPDGTVIKPEDKYPDEVIPKDYVIVTYDPNGGSGNIVRQMVKTNAATTVLDGTLFTAPRGKTFDKWVDDNDASKTYAAGDELTPTKDVTLKAQWKNSDPTPTTYSAEIVFDSNTGAMANQTLTSTTSAIITGKLDVYSFTAPENWTFMGWSTAKAASQYATFYEDEATVTLKHKDTLNLYAIVYKVDADIKVVTLPGANGEPNDADDVTVTPAEGSTITPGKGYVEAPKDSTIKLPGDKTITVVDGPVYVYPDGSVYVPDGSKVTDKDGNEVTGPTVIDKDGTVDTDKTKPIQKPDGTIILPGKDGNTGTDDDIIVKPSGDKPAGRIDEDGNVTITDPDGADVTIPGNDPEDVKVPAGTVITPDGTVTLVYTIQYVDESGKQLKTAVLKQLTVGEIETVKAVTIDGYKIKGDETQTITAALSADVKDYIITFTYEKKSDGGNTGGGSSGGGSSGGSSGGGSSVSSSFTIKASAGSGGIISPSGNVSVARGKDQTFSINPVNGYRISDVIVDGKSVGTVSTYTFDDVKANHTIEVKFVKLNSIVADPETTGVAGWLQTREHIAYLGGYGNGLFGANDNMTRAQAAQMFYNLLLNKDVDITVNFSDVPADAWYGKAVHTLASLGIIAGIGNNQFAPNRTITRAEFTVIAMRFANLSADVTNPFSDVSENDWFYSAVTSAVSYGWISGYSDGTFRPRATITRAEVATIVNRMLNRTADRNFVDGNAVTHFDDVPSTYWAYYNIMEATNAHTHAIDNDGVESWGELK